MAASAFASSSRISFSCAYRCAPTLMLITSSPPPGRGTGLRLRSALMRPSTAWRGENRSVPQRQHELVSAPAGKPVALPHTAPYHLCHVAEAGVACLVAVGVVYRLEPVEVHHRHREERP